MFWKTKKSTFKQRVDKFWAWFEPVAQQYFDMIEDGRCGDLAGPIGKQVDVIWPDFQWVFGPGPVHRGGHSFTLSGGGDPHGQFLAQQWLQAAPELKGWTFYASRQPGDITGDMQFDIEGHSFGIADLQLAPKLDEERQLVHVDVWHPEFCQASEGIRDTALFLILDEVLGEFGTGQWLGAINVVDAEPQEAIPSSLFRDYLHDLEVERGWRKLPPTESYTSYQLPNPSNEFARSDTVVGTTSHMRLIEDFLEASGPLPEDPLEGSGAEFAYIEFSSEVLPQGNEAEIRGQIEDSLAEYLELHGRVLGGAIGTRQSYIDLLLTDGAESLKRLKKGVRQSEILHDAQLNYFVMGKRSTSV